MATFRQVRSELGLTDGEFKELLSRLGIDSTNYSRNLTSAEESKIRNYLSGGNRQAPSPSGTGQGRATIAQEAIREVAQTADHQARILAASFTPMVLSGFANYINNFSTEDVRALLQSGGEDDIQQVDLSQLFSEGISSPFVQAFNQSLGGVSLAQSSILNPLLPQSQSRESLLPSSNKSESLELLSDSTSEDSSPDSPQ